MTEIFKGAAKRIESVDLPRIAARIGCGEDVLHALIEVETKGTGFDKQDRVIILFEPHIFYRLLRGEERQEAVDAGLAYKKWGEHPYPRESYTRLVRAMEINKTAALKSCSWGMGQIMGENFAMVGYGSVEEMVQAFAADEENHLEAMVQFIIANHIDDDLRRIQALSDAGKAVTAADWVPVVRVYNGAGYARNQYHTRAATAYNKWRRIKDTALGEVVDIQTAARIEEATNSMTVTTAPSGVPGDPGSSVTVTTGDAAAGAAAAGGVGGLFAKAKASLAEMEPESRKSMLSTVGSKLWGILCAGALYAANNPFKILVIGVIAIGGFWILHYYMKRQKDKTLAQIEATKAVTVAAIEAGGK